VAESVAYDGGIYSIASDNNYLYVGGSAGKIYKLNKSDLSKVAESVAYDGDAIIKSIASDDNYLYVGGSALYVDNYYVAIIFKLNKSDLSKVAESASDGEVIIESITLDDNFIYIGGSGGGTRKVRKLNKVAYIWGNKKLKLIPIEVV